MRQLAIFVAFLAGGALLGVTTPATSGPGPIASQAASSPVQHAGWRRYCRRHGCGPDVVYPGAVVAPDGEAGIDAEVDIESDAPAMIVLPPRPLSCGQYRYWDGRTCVDARYTDPYLGPK
jgi:hypothetical protein